MKSFFKGIGLGNQLSFIFMKNYEVTKYEEFFEFNAEEQRSNEIMKYEEFFEGIAEDETATLKNALSDFPFVGQALWP